MECVFIVHLTLRMLLQIEKVALIQQFVLLYWALPQHASCCINCNGMTEMFHTSIKLLCTQIVLKKNKQIRWSCEANWQRASVWKCVFGFGSCCTSQVAAFRVCVCAVMLWYGLVYCVTIYKQGSWFRALLGTSLWSHHDGGNSRLGKDIPLPSS